MTLSGAWFVDGQARLLEAFPAVRDEMRERVATKLQRWRREARRQMGEGGEPSTVLDDTYPNSSCGAAAGSASDDENSDVRRIEEKVDRLAQHMDYLVRAFNAAAMLADS